MRRQAVALAKRVLPEESIDWYRRRRAVRRYFRALGHELYDRQVRMQLEELEGRIAARRDGFYQQLVKDVLERSELVIQELDRRIEALSARHGTELRAHRLELDGVRADLAALRERLDAAGPLAGPPDGPAVERPAAGAAQLTP